MTDPFSSFFGRPTTIGYYDFESFGELLAQHVPVEEQRCVDGLILRRGHNTLPNRQSVGNALAFCRPVHSLVCSCIQNQ